MTQQAANNVDAGRAAQIAIDWTQDADLPDRYCPQEPVLDEDTECWRVPIFLVYSSGEGGLVGELLIDSKTGGIIQHTPIAELRKRGLALAETMLHGHQAPSI